MCSAWASCFCGSLSAFTIVAGTLAFRKALTNAGLSNCSHRTDDFVSGRRTHTEPVWAVRAVAPLAATATATAAAAMPTSSVEDLLRPDFTAPSLLGVCTAGGLYYESPGRSNQACSDRYETRSRRPLLLALVFGVFLVLIGVTATALVAVTAVHLSSATLQAVVDRDRSLIELFVNSTGAFDGYHATAEKVGELSEAGWKSVGDVAYVDDEGYVHICDRKKDMIISGGMNIYPAEIEAVLHAHPDVMDAAVFGIPSDEWGESVHATITLYEGASVTDEEIQAFVREHMASYKIPRSIDRMDEIPRSASGKILKKELRAPYWADRQSNV